MGPRALRVTVLCPQYPPMAGGVSDFTRRFASAIAALGAEVTVLTGPGHRAEAGFTVRELASGWGLAGIGALVAAVRQTRPDVVVVQYVPHLYERRGLSVAVNLAVRRLGRHGVPVVTIAHELYYGRHEGLRHQLPGALQRAMLLPLFAGSRRVVLTVPDRLARMRRVFPCLAERFCLQPIGNNLDPAPPEAGSAWRAARGIAPDELVLIFLGLAHPSKELASLERALARLDAAGLPARLIVAGGGAVAHARALNVGYLSAEEAQAALAAADLALLPLADGASTRRTSLMNALAAGLPVVSTVGANTDPALFPAEAIRLVAASDAEAFADAVEALARDARSRLAMGAAARRLFEAAFDWAVTGPRWLAILEEATGSRITPECAGVS